MSLSPRVTDGVTLSHVTSPCQADDLDDQTSWSIKDVVNCDFESLSKVLFENLSPNFGLNLVTLSN